MRFVIQDIKNITDSRESLESKPLDETSTRDSNFYRILGGIS